QSHYSAAQLGADRVGLTDAEPRIFRRLLESKRDALVLGVDIQDHNIDRVAFLHHFRRVLDTLRPRHVGDVNQTIDARLDLNKGAAARQVADFANEARTHLLR